MIISNDKLAVHVEEIADGICKVEMFCDGYHMETFLLPVNEVNKYICSVFGEEKAGLRLVANNRKAA